MKRVGIISLILCMFFVSMISAEVVITQQPNDVYNLGDTITVPVKIVALTDASDLLTMRLICNGIETEVYKEYLMMSAGEEKTREPSVPLIQSFLGRPTGTCKIKTIFGSEIKLSEEFSISDLIKLEIKNKTEEVAPGEAAMLEIQATKEDGKDVNGIIELSIALGNSSDDIEIFDTVRNGYGLVAFSFPKETAAGNYLVSVNVTERDSTGEITNKGFLDYNIKIKQIPTSLEIFFENENVEPDTNLNVKAILRDQAGGKIESTAMIEIKNSKGDLISQTEQSTDSFLEFPISYKEPSAIWTVKATSNEISGEAKFRILEKARVNTEILNDTLIVTNTGNIPYNNTVSVKIEETVLNIDVYLKIDESKRYLLSAPDGKYQVEILTEENNQIVGNVPLTGKMISVKEASGGVVRIIKHPVSWLFIAVILGYFFFVIFKKGYKKSFIGDSNISSNYSTKNILGGQKKTSLFATTNPAELSLSIKGDKQDANIVCLKIRNFREVYSNKNYIKDTLRSLSALAEERKAFIYENQETILFILAPIKTRTFNNEKNALNLAQKIKEELNEHNRKFKQKIDFGLSMNEGVIVAKQEEGVLKFMSMGTLITIAKKIAAVSNGEVLLSERMRDKLATMTKTEKHEASGVIYHTVKEFKTNEDHSKFLKSFLNRIEK